MECYMLSDMFQGMDHVPWGVLCSIFQWFFHVPSYWTFPGMFNWTFWIFHELFHRIFHFLCSKELSMKCSLFHVPRNVLRNVPCSMEWFLFPVLKNFHGNFHGILHVPWYVPWSGACFMEYSLFLVLWNVPRNVLMFHLQYFLFHWLFHVPWIVSWNL